MRPREVGGWLFRCERASGDASFVGGTRPPLLDRPTGEATPPPGDRGVPRSPSQAESISAVAGFDGGEREGCLRGTALGGGRRTLHVARWAAGCFAASGPRVTLHSSGALAPLFSIALRARRHPRRGTGVSPGPPPKPRASQSSRRSMAASGRSRLDELLRLSWCVLRERVPVPLGERWPFRVVSPTSPWRCSSWRWD